ncbi:hypothetical protein QQF64_034142 [Cirrhinus molitorella]|uniref:Ig-like domain-containing protein n=1 Tax=Cirrhinus molitorella TaxID=172907 RepID=A0ABR3MVX0_9TELE
MHIGLSLLQTFQHTHLSVTWFLYGEEDENPWPIITLNKDLTVKTGAGFEDRYRAGLISMHKVEDTTYILKMPQVQLSDQGKFYCKAIEWIQDADRSWTQIAHKITTACNVEIKPIVAPDAGTFSVFLKVSKGPLQVGDALDIRCSVNAQNLPGHFFLVTWLKNQQKVAQIGSSGVLTMFNSYKERESAAEVRAVKTSHADYLLTIRSARTEDQGQYHPETVSITAESDLAVVMEMKDAVNEGDPLWVTCLVSGFKGPLSVSWQHKKEGVSFSDVISLTHEGVMKDIGASGEYKCIVSEWTVQSNGEMKKANTQSQQKAIMVNSVVGEMSLYSHTPLLETTVNTVAKFECSVMRTTTNTSRFTITWMIGSQMILSMLFIIFYLAPWITDETRDRKGSISRMVDFWCRLWHLALLLCLTGLMQWDLCSGQIQVQIQKGPLYRVKGYPIFISCSVTGFTGPSERDFQFILKKPNMDVNMISTKDPDFPYGMFSGRIRNKEIEIQRLSGSSVLLKIADLLENDAGDLVCETLHTGGAYHGDYAAETKLNVIADTLEASYSGSPSQSLSEGDPLQLECQVSSQTFQHTHLSVTWFLYGEEDENPRPIITLDKDLTVKTGAGFEDRYRSGLISINKVEDTTYILKMPQVQLSDQGKFYCKAIEWIQDPDRSWTQIAHKITTACNVEIKPIVAPDAGTFSVFLKASKGPLQVGDALDIRCSVNAQNLPGHFFLVTWLKNQQKVAQIGSSGVLTMFNSYKERESAAEVRAVKTSHADYLLTIRSARTEDQGQYQCEVWQEDMNEDGTFKKIQKQMSSPETVNITVKESDLAVVMEMKDVVTEGDPLRVTCLVSGFKGPLSVSWQHKKDSGVSFSDVISLTHEGVLKDIGARYQSRHVRTLHSPAGNFTLEIGASATSDSGEYKCIVSEWTVQSNGEMKKANTQSQQKAIMVNSVESLMKVILTSRTIRVAIDSPVELLCRVRGPKVSLAVRWMFQPRNSTVQTNILSIHHTGEITWGADQRNYQLSIQAQPSDTRFILMVPRASKKQEGQYQCQVDAYQKDIQKAMKNSNPLAVTIRKPGRTTDLHVRTAAGLHQGFPWLRPAQA